MAGLCKAAVEQGIVLEAKHSDASDGASCFYLECDDMESHKKVIIIFLDNDMIQKTKTGNFIIFKEKIDNTLTLDDGNTYCIKNIFEIYFKEASEAYQQIFKANFEQLKAINNYAFSYRKKELTQEPLVKFRKDIEEQFVEKNSL